MYIKDSNGVKSLTATLAYIAFAVVMLKVLFNGASVVLADFSYSFGEIDSASIGTILVPVLGSYTARRWGNSASTGIDVPKPTSKNDIEDNGLGGG